MNAVELSVVWTCGERVLQIEGIVSAKSEAEAILMCLRIKKEAGRAGVESPVRIMSCCTQLLTSSIMA